MKTYSEAKDFQTFKERFEYLKLNGAVGSETFGSFRYLNQTLYQHSPRWKKVRREVILRDNGCDLGVEGVPINGPIFVHHINPLSKGDILKDSFDLYNPDNLICCSRRTHNALHYGGSDPDIPDTEPIVRTPNDTCPWKKGGDI